MQTGEPSGNFPDVPGKWHDVPNPNFMCRGRSDGCTATGGQVEYQNVDSNGHDDVHFHCKVCGMSWWVEGDDG